MKKYVLATCLATLAFAGNNFAQETTKKEKTKTSDTEEIIIRNKPGKDTKVTIEINNGEVKVNGKPIDDFNNDDVSVIRRKALRGTYYPSQFRATAPSVNGVYNYSDLEPTIAFGGSSNKAFLGVTSEDADDQGAKLLSVSENSGADKAGLKKGDIITKVGDSDIDDPNDLTKAISKLKPEDKVTITYSRDGKENKATATLGKNKSATTLHSYSMPGDRFEANPKIFGPDGSAFDKLQGFQFDTESHFFGRPRLGIRAQDTEDGKGVKVLDVAEESMAAKSGIKEGDIITQFDGKDTNDANELAEAAQESKDKTSVKVQLLRDGKSQTIEIKTPKKLKTANL